MSATAEKLVSQFINHEFKSLSSAFGVVYFTFWQHTVSYNTQVISQNVITLIVKII